MRSSCFIHKTIVLLVVLSLVLLLGSCSQGTHDEDVLRFGVARAPINLDPRFATDATSARINRLVYDRLVEFDDLQKPVPGIANWEKINNLHYRFTLKQSRTFHHGRPLTAADVVATYQSVLDPQIGSVHRGTLSIIKSIESRDDHVIDFYLEKEDPLFPAYLVIGLLPADLLAKEHAFSRNPVGSGDVSFVEWPSENRLRLKRTDDLNIEILHVGDPVVRVMKLEKGEIDLVQNDLSPELIGYLKKKEGIQRLQVQGSNVSYIGFNMSDMTTGNPDVRKAVALAIDRERFNQYFWHNSVKMANGLFPEYHWVTARGLEQQKYDPETSRKILQGMGYSTENPLVIEYKTSTDPVRLRIATILQSQLQKVGIQLDIKSYDWGTVFGDIKAGRFQMYSLTWVGLRTPDAYRYIFHSQSTPPEGANRGRYSNKSVDRWIEASEQQHDLESRLPFYAKIQKTLLEEKPYVFLWFADHIAFMRSNVKGYTMKPDGSYDGLLEVTLQ